MSQKSCPPLLAGLIGFILGIVALKLAERFCPLYGCCCGGEEECCCGDGEAECCCAEDDMGEMPEPEAEPAE